MNKLLTILALTLSFNAFADASNQCEEKPSKTPSKVIKRRNKKKKPCEVKIVQVTEVQPVIEHHHMAYREIIMPALSNRLFLIGGYAPQGIKTSVTGNVVNYNLHRGAVLGVGYERVLDNETPISSVVGIDALTNGSVLLKIGKDF